MIRHTGKWMRELRLWNQLTQKQAGELFGVCRSTYSNWESRYARKVLPEHILKHKAYGMLMAVSAQRPEKNKREKQTIKERVIQCLKTILKNLFR